MFRSFLKFLIFNGGMGVRISVQIMIFFIVVFLFLSLIFEIIILVLDSYAIDVPLVAIDWFDKIFERSKDIVREILKK